MSKEYKSRKKRISRRDLKEMVKEQKSRADRAESRAETAEHNADRINKRIRDIGMNCVDSVRGGILEHKVITPIPYGAWVEIINNGHTISPDDAIRVAKSDLASRLAKCLIEENLVQFIFHGADEYNPCDYMPLGRTIIGAKMYVVPWEKMSVWKDHVTVANIREYQNGW